MRLIQHKREAWLFYRFLSLVYDRVNPLFWTEEMRSGALALADLGDPALRTVDVGAGTGFTTEGIVERVRAENVVMLDQSPHQLAQSRKRAALERVDRHLGDAERLPFGDAEFDRYVSAGSIEYWPDPQAAIDEAYRVVRPGGVALVVGPLPPGGRLTRALARAWMLFPAEREYRDWFERAGFTDVRTTYLAPEWYRGPAPYAIAIAGTRGERPPPQRAPATQPDKAHPLVVAARFAAGSLAGFVFIPLALVARARARRG
jgi:MPBQ/MSBQ methyltransferase